MSLKHGLLGILNYSEMTGYELSRTFKDSLSFFWQAQTSQIYRELNKMEENGLLSSRIEIQTDKPNKRIYSITDEGKAELQNWLGMDMTDEMLPTRSEALLRLFFSSERTTEDTIKSLEHIVEIYRKQLVEFEEVTSTIDKYKTIAHSDKDMLYWDLTADFGREYSNMCLHWAENCIRRLEEGEQ